MTYVRITEALMEAAAAVAKAAVNLHIRALEHRYNLAVKVMDRKLDRMVTINQSAADARREYRQAMDDVATEVVLRDLRVSEAKARVL